jgi:D-aminoacyl-tRNA deacylase
MRLVIQRVSSASVTINGQVTGAIGRGLLVLLGIAHDDNGQDIDWLCKKLVSLRIFSDQEGKMNLDVMQVQGEVLVISQFTLFASTQKGNRPSFTASAPPGEAQPLYVSFMARISELMQRPCAAGQFGADMKVALVNDGPVTIVMDSRNKDGNQPVAG